MALDIYAPCPCGSGKKLKFCCQAISDEMLRIQRLVDDNQLRPALSALDKVEQKAANNPWVVTTRATVFLELQDPASACSILKTLLERHPDHEFAYGLYAMSMLAAEGYDPSRKVIQKAFLKVSRKYPHMCSHLALGIAVVMSERGQFMAAREHTALALRLAAEEDRQSVFMQLFEMDKEPQVPYPLRSTHHLPEFQGTDEQVKEYRKGQKFAQIGCFEAAADTFTALTSQLGDNAAVWQAAGLCRAWNGQEREAAQCLHKAAELCGDYPAAVECETLAQLLELNDTSGESTFGLYEGTVESVSRFLTVFDQQDLAYRVPSRNPENNNGAVATYRLLDRSRSAADALDTVTTGDCPRVIGDTWIEDAAPSEGRPARVFVAAIQGEPLETARRLVTEAAGDLVKFDDGAPKPISTIANQWQSLAPMRYLPPKLSLSVSRQLDNDLWKNAVDDVWMKTPVVGLRGKTPAEAAGIAELKVPLAAALYVLDAFFVQNRRLLDLEGLAAKLQVELLPQLAVSADTPLTNLSALQFQRLPLADLSDEQLTYALNRALVVQHPILLYKMEEEVVRRPACLEKLNQTALFQSLTELAHQRGDREQACRWLDEVRTRTPQNSNAFEHGFQCDVLELTLRLEDPSDEGIQPLLQKFVNYYSPKLPGLQTSIERMLASANVPSPWTSPAIVSSLASGGMASGGGLWTPGQPQTAGAGAGGSKLWLPGT